MSKGKYPVWRLMMWLRFKRLCVRLGIAGVIFGCFLGVLYAALPIDELLTPWPVPTGNFDGEDWMAVLGDSSVTGAAAHPEIKATWPVLGKMAGDLVWRRREEQHFAPNLADYIDPKHFDVHVPLEVTRVFYAPDEIKDGNLAGLNARAKAALKLDNEEYTFAYLVGRRLGYAGKRIVFAGEDGVKLGQLDRQFGRLRALGAKTLPSLTLISFVANDMCHPKSFREPVAEFGAKYRKVVREQFGELARQKPHEGGSRVVFVAPLDVANILSNEELLAQQINVDVDLVRCGDLRAGRVSTSWWGQPIERVLAGECPALLAPGDMKERAERVRVLQTEQVRVLREEVAAFAKIAPPGLKLDLAESVRGATFRTGDLANDCFHPGIGGHTRIANALLANEFRRPIAPDLKISDGDDEADTEP